jgi:hypothetical protein
LKPFIEINPCSRSAWTILWELVEAGNKSAIKLATDILKHPNVDLNIIVKVSQNISGIMKWFAPFIADWLKQGNVFL